VPWGAARAPGQPAAPHAASTIDVWFRFDSLGRGGTLAFLSLRGTVRPPPGDDDAASPGGVTGLLVVDLARGWVVDSRATFQLDGALTAPGRAAAPGARARHAAAARALSRPVRVLRGAARG
jgi:hypothetical protein